MILQGSLISERVYVSRRLSPTLGKGLRSKNPLELIQLVSQAMQTDTENTRSCALSAQRNEQLEYDQ